MKNKRTEHTENQRTAPMESQPLIKGLSTPHKGAVARLQMLINAPLQCWHHKMMQASKNPKNGETATSRLLGSGSSGAEISGSLAPSQGVRSKAPPPLQSNVAGRKGGRSLTNQKHPLPRIEKFYKQVVCFDLLLQCPLKSIMELSPPNKIVLNTSSKKIIQDKKELIVGLSACLIVSGQRCQTTWARKSIAAFKLREGSVIGCKVTLRGNSMYAFLDKLINLVLPRARPSLINQTIDPDGTYNIGISDPFLFVELEHHYDLFQSLQGFDIALVMSPKEKGLPPLFWSGFQLLTE